MENYISIGLLMIIGLAIGLIPIATYCVSKKKRAHLAKAATEAFECGFPAQNDPDQPFHIRFHLIAILFLIFDLETAFLFPWAVSLRHIHSFAFWSMLAFILILSIGFLYEWAFGALDWS